MEVILKNKVTNEIFDNVIKRIKGIPNIKLNSSAETLDIFLENSNLRYTVLGSSSINKYCKTNNLLELKNGSYILIKKSLVKKIDINNYNIRFNLKKEEQKSISKLDKENENKFLDIKKGLVIQQVIN